ncbi:DUF2218 domain-containing protein [Frankia sp. CNm7]|uniref:DUF2218 domain-containing protein n=1 Tax=Frankia nepalensis TaxID=1836974 RepID=A0A937RL31_9ACTN|nr:DUF2218 domain-containing protein [Frankia nepalensis]MBL7497866.1 DUF2218 domain-containing protein [Frankia nepalensis]MBL7509689.1 DUF2218 domain-containing protein [Frankia nepalensis]MBL7517624.1 DUF2218 domain-containing protein [Frankia nepalensis]MBL7630814.1 DUF2218 domain-containing protein [Frankia nepalensis]
MSDMQQAHARVRTDAAPRYLKQLASDLGRRVEPVETTQGTMLTIAGGTCLLTATGDSLLLHAAAPTTEGLDRVKDVVGGQLELFGARNELTVSWT